MNATERQRTAIHKFGVRELDPELSREEAASPCSILDGR